MPLSDRDKRTLKIGGIVGGVILVGVLLMSVLGGGGGEDTSSGLPPETPATESPTPEPTITGTPTVAPTPIGVFSGRDPFSVPGVFSVSSSGSTSSSSGSSTSSSSSSSTSSSSGTSTSSPGGSSTQSSPPTQPGNGSSTTVGGHEVVLLDVFVVNGVDTVQVEVDGTIYNASEGEAFGPGDRYEVRSISGNCASFLYGDESFTLCVNPQK